jgi:hypothetical protein
MKGFNAMDHIQVNTFYLTNNGLSLTFLTRNTLPPVYEKCFKVFLKYI